jgi:hydrogenase/urease accessory protein HupE
MRTQGPPGLRGLLVAILLIAPLFHVPDARAHESRPAYLQIHETAPNRYDVIWRTPLFSGMRLPVVLKLPDGLRNIEQPRVREFPGSLLERREVEVTGGLAGKQIDFVGLQATITDVLVRVEALDGAHATTLVHPSQPYIEIAASRGLLATAGAYVVHGVEHILFGFDHLLFVLALILIVRDTRMLLLTVTAFTVAHSITLSLATLGLVHVPGPPVEACIALSILLAASEIVRLQRGEPSLTASRPWAVAFSFGLLHGLGFASALIDIGLPQRDVPLALFAFNVGVELGQLAFIAAVLGVIRLAKQLPIPAVAEDRLRLVTSYAIGTVAAFWFVQRVAGFWT